MASVDSRKITAFLTALGEQYPRKTKLILLGGGALCLLGSPRPTLDLDYAGSDLKKDDLQILMDKIAYEMGLDVEAVPIQDFTPLSSGEEKRAIHIGKFGNIEVTIIDPYVIAFSKLDRGLDTDIGDIIFLIEREIISLPQLEQIIKDTLPQVGKFDINSRELEAHLQAVRDQLN